MLFLIMLLKRKKKGRVDITDQPAVTIDGDDSKDFDDAVVLWKKA